jgi:hypothetical protein
VTDRREVSSTIRKLRAVKTWQLLILLLIAAFITATLLRLNNVGMIQRRDAVLASDKAADEVALPQRLYDLQRYTAAHSNANTGPFYLEYQYRRDAQKAVDAAKNDDNPNGNINAKAEAVCKPQYKVWSPAYVQCFTDELAKYPPSPDPVQNVSLPSTELYRHNFAAPLWAPDFAGWLLVVDGLIILLIVGRLASLVLLRLILKYHYRGI